MHVQHLLDGAQLSHEALENVRSSIARWAAEILSSKALA
jgi:hypothetical protein